MTYLDYQATTPLAPEARDAMLPWLGEDGFANPHSAHVAGRRAKAAVEVAREQVAALLPAGGRVVFTSGATEAVNWALKGREAQFFAASSTEHAAVLDTLGWLSAHGRDVSVLPVAADGRVSPSALPDRLDVLAVMQVNNEIGTIQPVGDLAAAAKARGAVVLCDAVQGFGRLAPPENCDMIAVSAHKIHGPKGIGALWIRDGVVLEPLLHGGGQEAGLRSGTLSPALCAGFGAAAALAKARMAADRMHVEQLWASARAAFGSTWHLNGSETDRWHGNLNVRRPGLDVARLMSELRDIAFSAGSACASGSGRSSHVLRAIALSEAEARSSVRIGFGRYTTEEELLDAVARIDAAARAQERLAA